ncbi:MAG: hypothetical protein Q7J45_00635 [bacterium]|nr:hypothetical protein [bacterium]
MSKLFGFLGSNLGVYAIFAFVIALGAGLVTQTMRLSAAEVALAKEKVTVAGARTAAAEQRAVNASQAKLLSEANRQVEEVKKQGAKDVANAVLKEQSNTKVAVAKALSDARDRESVLSVQREFAAFTAGTGGPSGSAAAAGAGLSAQERATAIGLVLATCTESAITDAGELEDQASQIRGLQAYDAVVNGIWDQGEHR